MARIAIPDGEGEETARMWAVRPEMARGPLAFSTAVYSNSKLPVRLREFARIRIAQINDCPV
jgi:alkylhydroperoxidase family enzyme